MQKALVAVLILCLGMGAAAFYVFGRPQGAAGNGATAGKEDGSGNESVAARAIAAYNAKEYEKALPLFKEWLRKVGTGAPESAKIASYIDDIELKLKPGAVAATDPAVANDAGASPKTLSELKQQAMAIAQAQNATDVAMGADRVPHVRPKAGEVPDWSIKQLGNFEFDPTKTADIPEDIKKLDGIKVKLKGFMIPMNQAERITDFSLVPSLTSCCFGQPPGVQHIITCRVPPEKAVEYVIDELKVQGTLHVEVKKDHGYTYEIFSLDVEKVESAF